MPVPDMDIVSLSENYLIYYELNYDRNILEVEYKQLLSKMTF